MPNSALEASAMAVHTKLHVPLPFPTGAGFPVNWAVPRFNNLSKNMHFHNQWLFWNTYATQVMTWEKRLPLRLEWRRRQLIRNIVEVLRKLKAPPAVDQFLCELAMLQNGWDALMDEIYGYFVTINNPASTNPTPTICILNPRPTPKFIAYYARIDSTALEAIYKNPASRTSTCLYDFGMDPMRPDVATVKLAGETCYRGMKAGPILMDPMMDIEAVPYKCGVAGCAGGWWFETALKAHQAAVPHRMVRAEWWAMGANPPTI